MNADARKASLILDSVARAVANWTVEHHVETHSDLVQRYGPSWRADWLGHTLAQLALLAQATAVRSAELFAQSVRWTHQSFTARGINGDDLLRNLSSLRHVLARELPPPVAERIVNLVDRAGEHLSAVQAETESRVTAPMHHRDRMLRYLEAILEVDRSGAERIIREAVNDRVDIPAIYEQILAPAQARLGEMWHRGEITVADEHMGSATTQTVMAQLRLSFQRAPSNGRSVVGTATAGDLHEIGLRMVTDLFELNGWDVVFLGANTPGDDVIDLLSRRNPNLLALSISTALTLRDAADLIGAIRATPPIAGTKLLVGGPPFRMVPELWRELGADGCAHSATEAVIQGNLLVGS